MGAVRAEDVQAALATMIRWLDANTGGKSTIVVRTAAGDLIFASSEPNGADALETAAKYVRADSSSTAPTEPPPNPGKAN